MPQSDTEAAESAHEVAIVGIGCRMPGGIHGPRSLWDQVSGGVDAIGPIPRDRWDADRYFSPDWQRPGRMNSRQGGFLERVDGFDAAFFGVPRRVAEQMDPQQRLLLEVCWEALEDAGIVPDALAGTRTGVFVGGCTQDYADLQIGPGDLAGMGAHSATGQYMSILSNRLSYTFDLRGPSMTVDTACSSSLVAVHLAATSLRRGESDLAVAGGVNVILAPGGMIALSQASMFAPDGRSRTFDATAAGYVRGEGSGVVVLKPLEQAVRDRDRIYAVIRGSAVNQDGRTQGITVPSGTAQEANFRAALDLAGIEPRDVGYVEAHGTGTPVGDPIEANALGRVLAAGREPENVAYVGSIKSNIGHLEAGAGIAGLIKAALSVHHRRILPNQHFEIANPEIEFERWHMEVPTAALTWPEHYPRAIASVNSFGFGGTNANVVLEQAPERPDSADTTADTPTDPPTVLTLSARSPEALRRLARRYADHLAESPAPVDAVAANLALRRSHHAHRLAIVARDTGEAVARLRAHADSDADTDTEPGKRRKVAFLFNGQGPQWFAMGRTLLRTSPVFREKIIECDRAAAEYVDWSILDALTADEQSSPISATYCLQPTMFAVQVALAHLWKSWGVEPDGVAGHSMGEIAAAHISGALDLSTALRVICHRAAIQDDADATGGMMFVALPADEAEALCERYPGELWLAARNSPRASTLSGRRSVLASLVAELSERDVFARILKVNCACHSADMDPLEERLRTEIAGVEGKPTTVRMYSTVTGGLIDGESLDTGYWWQNFRQPVLFEPAVRAMLADGFDTFVELSPHPVLGNSVVETVREAGAEAVSVCSLVRNKDDWECFLEAFGKLYTAGVDIDWRRRFAEPVPALDLPVNPWVHESFWHESEVSREDRLGEQRHPMLRRVDGVRPAWEIDWDDHRLSWVRHHEVFGSVLVPGAAHIEAALAAARELTGEPCALEYVEFERACVLPGGEPVIGRVELNPDEGTFTIHSRPVRGASWVRNAFGRYHRAPATPSLPTVFDLDAIRARCAITHEAIDVYGTWRSRGYAYGAAFCGIDVLHVGDGETFGRIAAPLVLDAGAGAGGYVLHPALLDACFQSVLAPTADGTDAPLVPNAIPTGVDQVRVHDAIPVPLWCYTRLSSVRPDALTTSVYLLDDDGRTVAEYTGLRAKSVRRGEGTSSGNEFHELVWQRDADNSRPPQISTLTTGPADVLATLPDIGDHLRDRLHRHGYATDYQRRVRELCSAFVMRCLADFGRARRVGEEFAVSDFAELQPEYRRVFETYLRFLVEDGVFSERDGRYRVEQLLSADPDELWAALLTDYPACVWELRLVRTTGARLHAVLTGAANPLELLFPAGSTENSAPVYDNSPAARYYNALMREAVRRFAAEADPHRTLRVLEVGGGTGGLTAAVLPVLPADRCEYVFTDVSSAFTQAARERFGEFGFVDYRTLDIEDDAHAQGFEPGSFDLVIASDVVHATADLKLTLVQLRDLLAPGGVLGLIEAAPGSRWLELTYGLTAGWWLFRDLRLRPDGPLLATSAWEDVLRSAGYEDVGSIGDPGHRGAGSQSVLLARAPESEFAAEAATIPDPAGDWIVIGQGETALAERIEAQGGRAVCLRTGQTPDFADVRPRKIVYFWDGPDDAVGLEESTRQHVIALSSIARALDEADLPETPRVYLVTQGVHALRNPSVRLGGASAWGVGLVIGRERPSWQCTMIDLAEDDTDALWSELCIGDHEREILLRQGERFVRRLVAVPEDEVRDRVDARELREGTGFELRMAAPGVLDDLDYRVFDRVPPGPGQVELEVVATGVNFLDVMTALGQVPPLEDADGYRFGTECSGVVTRVGAGVCAGVDGIRVGDRVVAVAPGQGAIASHLTVAADFVVPQPESLTPEEAATVPVVFLTASYALRRLARLQPGERVLIHSAAGGTGLAAIQIARLAGAEVLATAGSPEKRALLRALGVRHVMDSRSVAFADEVLAATGGAGVDVVFGAATGEAATRSIACLAPYGRYVDIGKRDLISDRHLGLRPFLRNLAYFSFDLRQLMEDRPQVARAELTGLFAEFAAGTLRPLPYLVQYPGQVRTAMRRLMAGGHVGKVVLAMDDRDLRVAPALRPSVLAGPTGTWLITGGLRGLGLAVARRLVDAGVRHLVLVGRSGVADDRARAEVARLCERGVTVVAEAVDVSDREAVRELLDRIDAELPELRGVVHSAMVLDDALLADLDDASVHQVLAPKVLGALSLHELTATRPLEAFVLFSSATSMVGNIGQAAYAAANAVLDQLAEARRAQGLPALAVNWGALSDVGYVSRNELVQRQVSKTGLRGLTAEQAFKALRGLLAGDRARVGVLSADWAQFFRHHGIDPVTEPRYDHLYARYLDGSQQHMGAEQTAGDALLARLGTVSEHERAPMLAEHLKARLVTALGVPAGRLSDTTPLTDYIDSLLAVEISVWIERELDTKVSVMDLMRGKSVAELCTELLGRMAQAA